MNRSLSYRKFLINKTTVNQNIVEYIENCLIKEDDVAKHSFHKVIINYWSDKDEQMFEMLSDYFGATVIPVLFVKQNNITTFYTSSLLFVLHVIKEDFMLPHTKNMCNIEILFNDKTSTNCFGSKVTIDDIVSGMVSLRFSDRLELDLSNFCQDPVFDANNIYFYDLSLLSYFKILMLRMGRDTEVLNLSNNKLSQIPVKILNFFLKGQLTGVNLSNNNIRSFTILQRISSKIEKLWVEGNPLCVDVDPITYMKQIVQKFPRLTELDGVKLNEHGVMMPIYQVYLVDPERQKTSTVVEKFVSLYFSHFDSSRKKIDMFYDAKAVMTLSSPFIDSSEGKSYASLSRNIINSANKDNLSYRQRVYRKRAAITNALLKLPRTTHDLTTFTIDVLTHDDNFLILVIDGAYKEKATYETSERILQFRRTFIFSIEMKWDLSYYTIKNEMFSVSLASPEIIKNSFLHPIRNMSQFNLINPEQNDKDVLCRSFMHLTKLKKSEAEARLLFHDWDIRVALKSFISDFRSEKIVPELFCDESNESSDISSISDEID